jgi:Tfp pilus assembly protein PilX
MNKNLHTHFRPVNQTGRVIFRTPLGASEEARPRRSEGGIALVITLLMLSVITFLAIAFLAMSRRDRAAVTVTLDSATAQNMSDAAFNRAQAEIIAQMMAHGDALSYDYMVSRNYISPYGFNKNSTDTTNVNYDIYSSSGVINPPFNMAQNQSAWAQNIANLYYDPRPPVFVVTNPAFPARSDFRFWVDINRNGRFETNGFLPVIAENGRTNGNFEYFNGEPEWIGVLRDPLHRHSGTNTFGGRYAYMVLPIGKTLDFNYIHNWAKGNYVDTLTTRNFTNTSGDGLDGSRIPDDGFARDQGVASYELNLAALLDIVCPDAYEYGLPNVPLEEYSIKPPDYYRYYPPDRGVGQANSGYAFDDAEAFVHYRYWIWPLEANSPYLGFGTLHNLIPSLYLAPAQFNSYGIDAHCLTAQTTPPFDPTNRVENFLPKSAQLWPGSYSSNMFYDLQDLFDPTKTSAAFTNRMLLAGSRTNSEDRYTFERLLNNISMGSQPEYGVWVHGDTGALTLRTKVNINFSNTAQIQSGPYTPMPTNLVNWTPLGFFTNAAELLLRSQTFTFTNYEYVGGVAIPAYPPITNYFGATNIPVFRVYYPGIRYNEAIHRMLQLAANIYSDTVSSNYLPGATGHGIRYTGTLPNVRHPFVFRPLYQEVNVGTSNWGVNIVGWTNVSTGQAAYNQLDQKLVPYVDLTSNNVIHGTINSYIKSGRAFNLNGIPWVISAEQGLPCFYDYAYNNRVLFARKVLFVRSINGAGLPNTNEPPVYTNQFTLMSISNSFGVGAWNPYTTPFTGSANNNFTTYYLAGNVTVEVTNNYDYGYTTNFSYLYDPATAGTGFQWPAWSGIPTPSSSNGFVTLFSSNIITVPPSYFSESYRRLIFLTNNPTSSNMFLSEDTHQKGWPVHHWTLSVTNHVVYALFEGYPSSGVLLDYVNLGPFGSFLDITSNILGQGSGGGLPPGEANSDTAYWYPGRANDLPGSPMSTGLINQIDYNLSDQIYYNSLVGLKPGNTGCIGGFDFGPDINPSNVLTQVESWAANDPLVHYTTGDLKPPGPDVVHNDSATAQAGLLLSPVTNSVGGIVRERYDPWGIASGIPYNDMLYQDPMITSASAWQFPSNKFPSVGWLGRVHRGTPWQTVYFKSDNPKGDPDQFSGWTNWVNTLDTYPTNDWVLADLFTTALNDNSARGLLSVNQTNDAAWAAALAGVIALSNINVGVQILPTNVYQFVEGTLPASNPTNGINYARSLHVNGLFHHVGDILAAPVLTVQSPFVNYRTGTEISDEVVERIPQQIMGLLKVGEPQFVIYAWGESLRPKNLYLSSPNNNLCTNYEITGEFLSRTVCHVVHTNGTPKMVIDSYNVEPSD